MTDYRDRPTAGEQIDFLRTQNPFDQIRWVTEKIFIIMEKIKELEEAVTDDKPKSKWR